MYAIKWSWGQVDQGYETEAAARAEIRNAYPTAVIGHSGDLSDGGDRTLAWSGADEAAGDDGRRSFAAIVPERRELEMTPEEFADVEAHATRDAFEDCPVDQEGGGHVCSRRRGHAGRHIAVSEVGPGDLAVLAIWGE